MNEPRTSLVFFGSEEFSAPSLRTLIDAGWQIEAVITKPDSRRGRGKQLVAPLVKQIAAEHGIATLQPATKAELADTTASLKSQLAVLVSYGMIIPATVIDHFPLGIINVHPSKLPELRGPAPIEYTILEGKDELWVSIMKLDEGMDTGPVYAQAGFPIAETITALELSSMAADTGAELLLELLPRIESQQLEATPQERLELQASFSKMIKKDDGAIDPTTMTATQIDRKVRAYNPWPGAKIDVNDQPIKLIQVTSSFDSPEKLTSKNEHLAVSADGKHLFLRCAEDTALKILSIQPQSKKPMTSIDFLNGNFI